MNLAQTMISMHKAGCSAEQLAAVASDYEEARIRRRCERAVSRALFTDISATADSVSPVSTVANPDSAAASVGAATAAGGTPKAVARAALLMMPGLKPAARRIGARLIEHHNLGTGRCDPSVVGMARSEGLEERSVRRALAELVAAGLLRRVIHGAGRRNAYQLDWAALRGHAEAAENGSRQEPLSKPDSMQTRTDASGNLDGRVLQNLRRNTNLDGEGGTRGRDRRQRELPLMAVVATGKPPAERTDPIEAAIRGKYRGDHQKIATMLAGWWSLDDAQRAVFGTLATFEAWLRQHDPPKGRRSG